MSNGMPMQGADWQRVLQSLPFMRRLPQDMLDRTRAQLPGFLASKRFTGAAGMALKPAHCHLIAAQACLPINRLHLDWYRDFVEIVVYPDQFLVEREEADEDGVVHVWRGALSGESMHGGPVVLSWADVCSAMDDGDDMNVVVHEFAHKLDLADGVADGCPPLRGADRVRWQQVMQAAYDRFRRRCEAVLNRIPPHLDPDSDEAASWWDGLPLDPYAATDPAEFFAVASEAYFMGTALQDADPGLHAQLELLYGSTAVPA